MIYSHITEASGHVVSETLSFWRTPRWNQTVQTVQTVGKLEESETYIYIDRVGTKLDIINIKYTCSRTDVANSASGSRY